MTALDVTVLLRDLGYAKVTQERQRGFWCQLSDITNEDTIQKVTV